MQYLIDSANLSAIAACMEYYPTVGVTTNPTIISREKRPLAEVLSEIREHIGTEQWLFAQVIADDAEDMRREAHLYADKLGGKFSVKIPATRDGLRATRLLTTDGIPVTVTAVFTPQQALLAARAGAAFVAPYVNKLDAYAGDGIALVSETHSLFTQFGLSTKILAASFRNATQVNRVALAGADYITLPPAFYDTLIDHPLTTGAVDGFHRDWHGVYGDTPLAKLL